MNRILSACGVAATAALVLAGCADDAPITGRSEPIGKTATLSNTSVTPALVKPVDITGLTFYSVISSDDSLPASPGYRFGGSADGMGILANSDGTYTMLVNHEDNFSVSRLSLDGNFKPTKGEYLVNSTGGLFRLCSATMATPEEHGFGPVFLTAGESSQESLIHGIDPLGATGQSNTLPALGRWNAEQAVPLPREAYGDRTVVLIGDDDSGPYGGQVAMYVGGRGDLATGSVFVMARTDNTTRERDMVVGRTYPIEFRKIENHLALTGLQINTRSADLNAIAFGRVEDIDYRKSHNGREIYINVTGQNTTGANADYSRTKYGRVYRLELDKNDPTKGTLEVILDGDDRSGIAGRFQNPDNILVTRNYVYVQEDPNGYGDETHDSYVYQYDINRKTMRVALELDHRRSAGTYGNGAFGSWEYGAMLDVSDMLGNEVFALAVQPHTWRGAKYQNPDGGSLRPSENQASQIVLIKGLGR
jgi:hypothetical protein